MGSTAGESITWSRTTTEQTGQENSLFKSILKIYPTIILG